MVNEKHAAVLAIDIIWFQETDDVDMGDVQMPDGKPHIKTILLVDTKMGHCYVVTMEYNALTIC